MDADERFPFGRQAGVVLPRRARRWWRRLERRAVADHERAVLAHLQQMGAEGAAVTDLQADTRSASGVIGLRLSGRWLALAGVTAATRERLTTAAAAGTRFRLSGSGRYGPYWWIALSDGLSRTLVAGTHVRLMDTGDGGPWAWRQDGPPRLAAGLTI